MSERPYQKYADTICEMIRADREAAESELSRLREALEKTKADQAEMLALVKEMREAHINTLSIARIKWGNLDQDVNTIFEKAEQSIAKADAILGESGGKK